MFIWKYDIEFNIFYVVKQPGGEGEFYEVDEVEEIVEEMFNKSICFDPLQVCLVNYVHDGENFEAFFMLIY